MAYNAFHNFDPFVYAVQSDLQLRGVGMQYTTSGSSCSWASPLGIAVEKSNAVQGKFKAFEKFITYWLGKNGWGLLMTFL